MHTRHLFLPIFVILLVMLLFACQAQDEPTPAPVATTAPTAAPTDTAIPAAENETSNPSAPTPELADILTIIRRADGLDAFAAIAEKMGVSEQLSSNEMITLLLPTNAAIDELPAAVRENRDIMHTIVSNHIVVGKYHLDEMASPMRVATLGGDELSLLVGETGGTIGGANVLGGDFEAANGIIHIIDTVILPVAVEADVLALYESKVGESLQPMQGNNHIGNNELSSIAYHSTPPTSGPHYPNIAPWQVYEEPWRYEQLLHNLEDAGIVIYYQCPDGCPELVQQLRDLTQPYIDGGRHLLVAPNDPNWTTPDGTALHQDMGAPIVLTAWRRLLKLDEFDADKINAFIDAFEGIDHHVK